MNDPIVTTEEALATAVRDFGRLIGDEPDRLRGLLVDLLGPGARAERAAVDAVVVGADTGIPSALRSATAESPLTHGELTSRLLAEGFAPDLADRAVEAWVTALGVQASVVREPVAAPLAPDRTVPVRIEALAGPGPGNHAHSLPAALSLDLAPAGSPPAGAHARSRRRMIVAAGAVAAVLAAGAVAVARTGGQAGSGVSAISSSTSAPVSSSTAAAGASTSTGTTSTTLLAATTSTVAATTTVAPPTEPPSTVAPPPADEPATGSEAGGAGGDGPGTTARRITTTTRPITTTTTTTVVVAPPPPPPPPPPDSTTTAATTPVFGPVADADAYDFVWAGGTVSLNVGQGDAVGSGGTIKFKSWGAPTHGDITGEKLCGGYLCLVYTPHHNGTFTDGFTYTIVDPVTGLTSAGNVTLTVRCNTTLGACYAG